MKSLEQGQDKIDKICEALRLETLEPAMKKAEEILEEAKRTAEHKIREAEREAQEIVQKAKAETEQQYKVFQSSLAQGAKLALEKLRQEIEHQLFNPGLEALIVQESSDPKVIGRIINALIEAVEKEGFASDLQAEVPKSAKASEINALIAKNILEKLEGKSVQLGSFKGGARVKIGSKKMTIDISDEALKELLASFASKDFRNFIFNER